MDWRRAYLFHQKVRLGHGMFRPQHIGKVIMLGNDAFLNCFLVFILSGQLWDLIWSRRARKLSPILAVSSWDVSMHPATWKNKNCTFWFYFAFAVLRLQRRASCPHNPRAWILFQPLELVTSLKENKQLHRIFFNSYYMFSQEQMMFLYCTTALSKRCIYMYYTYTVQDITPGVFQCVRCAVSRMHENGVPSPAPASCAFQHACCNMCSRHDSACCLWWMHARYVTTAYLQCPAVIPSHITKSPGCSGSNIYYHCAVGSSHVVYHTGLAKWSHATIPEHPLAILGFLHI